MLESKYFSAGNIRENSLHHIWEESDTFLRLRKFNPNELKGVCGRCVLRN